MTEAESEARRQRATDARKRADDVFRAVLATASGREFVARVIYELGALKSLGFNVDPHLRDFHQGRRSVGHALEREAQRVARDEWALLENERTTRIRNEPQAAELEDEDD